MKVIKIGERRIGLNVRQLLNPIFFTGSWPLPGKKHPDSTRQRRAVQRTCDLATARELKRKFQYVPLCLVPPPEKMVGYWRSGQRFYGSTEMQRHWVGGAV
jgi:hypothetical protein